MYIMYKEKDNFKDNFNKLVFHMIMSMGYKVDDYILSKGVKKSYDYLKAYKEEVDIGISTTNVFENDTFYLIRNITTNGLTIEMEYYYYDITYSELEEYFYIGKYLLLENKTFPIDSLGGFSEE